MSTVRSSRTSRLTLALRKLFVSSFVVFSFVAYVVRDRLINSDTNNNVGDLASLNTQSRAKVALGSTVPTSQFFTSTPQVPTQQPIVQQQLPTDLPTEQPTVTDIPTLQPTATNMPTQQPTPTDLPSDQLIDGTYVGPTTNAFYGLVQVQATIQNGQLTDVQFLQYPSDRNTSRRINSIAMPRLITESLQVQSAYVHIVSGATLTSQAFAQSLYSILTTQAVS